MQFHDVDTAVDVGETLPVAARVEVRLGPQAFLDARDFYLSRRDVIEVTGIEFAERGKNLVVANEVRKNGESLVLSGNYGKPVWVEAHGYTCPVCGN